MKDLLMTSEAAQLLGLTPAGLRYHVARNRVKPAARTPRGLRLYTLTEILRFRRERMGTAEASAEQGNVSGETA